MKARLPDRLPDNTPGNPGKTGARLPQMGSTAMTGGISKYSSAPAKPQGPSRAERRKQEQRAQQERRTHEDQLRTDPALCYATACGLSKPDFIKNISGPRNYISLFVQSTHSLDLFTVADYPTPRRDWVDSKARVAEYLATNPSMEEMRAMVLSPDYLWDRIISCTVHGVMLRTKDKQIILPTLTGGSLRDELECVMEGIEGEAREEAVMRSTLVLDYVGMFANLVNALSTPFINEQFLSGYVRELFYGKKQKLQQKASNFSNHGLIGMAKNYRNTLDNFTPGITDQMIDEMRELHDDYDNNTSTLFSGLKPIAGAYGDELAAARENNQHLAGLSLTADGLLNRKTRKWTVSEAEMRGLEGALNFLASKQGAMDIYINELDDMYHTDYKAAQEAAEAAKLAAQEKEEAERRDRKLTAAYTAINLQLTNERREQMRTDENTFDLTAPDSWFEATMMADNKEGDLDNDRADTLAEIIEEQRQKYEREQAAKRKAWMTGVVIMFDRTRIAMEREKEWEAYLAEVAEARIQRKTEGDRRIKAKTWQYDGWAVALDERLYGAQRKAAREEREEQMADEGKDIGKFERILGMFEIALLGGPFGRIDPEQIQKMNDELLYGICTESPERAQLIKRYKKLLPSLPESLRMDKTQSMQLWNSPGRTLDVFELAIAGMFGTIEPDDIHRINSRFLDEIGDESLSPAERMHLIKKYEQIVPNLPKSLHMTDLQSRRLWVFKTLKK